MRPNERAQRMAIVVSTAMIGPPGALTGPLGPPRDAIADSLEEQTEDQLTVASRTMGFSRQETDLLLRGLIGPGGDS